jgi:HlyD family secretion protein
MTRSQSRPLRTVAAVVTALGGVAVVAWFGFRAVPVEVVVAHEGSVAEEIRAPGSVSSRTEVEVSSRVAGVVAQVLVEEGDQVESGQLLVTLDDRELRGRAATARAAAEGARHSVVVADAALDRAESDLTMARSTMARDEALFGDGHVTRAGLDGTTTALRAAEAGEKSAAATLEARRADALRADEEAKLAETVASYSQITAPLAGLVTERQVEIGNTVAPGSVLFRIVDDETVCAATRVDVSQMGRVALGLPARIRLASGDELTGTVARIAYESDPVTRDQEVRILFDVPPSHLTLAEEAQVVIRIGDATGLVVPGTAVITADGSETVLLARDGRVVQVPVRVRAMGQGAVVLDGLAPGDLVVFEPADVKAGQRVSPLVVGD